MKRPALQNKQVGVLRMAFRARKVFGTFEKRTPGEFLEKYCIREEIPLAVKFQVIRKR